MPLSRPQLHLAATREAMRAHRELRVDVSRRVDPFEALRRAGVVVIRRRLEHLAGAYLPGNPGEERPDGVLINAAHPHSKQRYTAAHELAHHRRDRLVVLDADTEWLGRGEAGKSDIELFAEAFAAWFLMPKRLVEATMDRLGLRAGSLDGRGAYALALELGTSYRATVHHLADMGVIPTSLRRRLLKLEPRIIKRELSGADVVADSWRDVWEVDTGQNRQRIWPMEGDALVLMLPEVPSSGYLWRTAQVPAWLELVRSEYSAPPEEIIGGRGQRRFVFRVSGRGHQTVSLAKVRPWEPDTIVEAFQLDVAAQPRPKTGEVEPELLAAAAN